MMVIIVLILACQSDHENRTHVNDENPPSSWTFLLLSFLSINYKVIRNNSALSVYWPGHVNGKNGELFDTIESRSFPGLLHSSSSLLFSCDRDSTQCRSLSRRESVKQSSRSKQSIISEMQPNQRVVESLIERDVGATLPVKVNSRSTNLLVKSYSFFWVFFSLRLGEIVR